MKALILTLSLTFTLALINVQASADGSDGSDKNFIAFNASMDHDEVKLHWETAHDHDGDYFVVQYSEDGEHWEDVDEVESLGEDGEEKHSYDAWEHPYVHDAVYYRIKLAHDEEELEYSPIQKIGGSTGSGMALNIYANPQSGVFTITGGFHEDQMEMHNEFGRKVPFLIHGTQLELIDKIPGRYYLTVLHDGTAVTSDPLEVN